jgi:hypothetical protein
MRTPKHFVNLMGESKNFKMLETESTPKHFLRKNSTVYNNSNKLHTSILK